jgi:hypothetical protein
MDEKFASYKPENILSGIKIGFSNSYKSSKSTFSSNRGYSSVVEKAGLTDKQNDLLDEIKRAIHKTNRIENLKKELNSINENALDNLSKDKARIIYIASSIGYSSTKYWKENRDKWKDLVKSYANKSKAGNMPQMKFDWSELGASDVGGAVAGGVTSAITGCAELTLGACAGVGAVGGGVGASAGNAVYQLLE